MEKLTVLIPTYNEEKLIADALKSVSWADEILVVDSGSVDKTIEICKKYTDRILTRKYNYYADQVNWGIRKAKNQWVLLLDADERLMPDLQEEIKQLFKKPDELNKYNGYKLARRHYFFGKWLRHGGRYPLYNIRLFQKDSKMEDRMVHPHVILNKSQIGRLEHDVIHLSDRNFDQYFKKFNNYTSYEAQEMYKNLYNEKKISWRQFFTNYLVAKSTIKRFWVRIPGSPMLRFIYMYFLRLGFLDGREGFIIARFYAFSDYVSKVKLKQLKKERNAGH